MFAMEPCDSLATPNAKAVASATVTSHLSRLSLESVSSLRSRDSMTSSLHSSMTTLKQDARTKYHVSDDP